MNFLAVDTSSDYLSVVAVKDGKCYSAFVPDCAMKHSVTLMTKVDEIFEESGLRPENLDFFSATVGAGSFTGIRIGISAIKGLALACGKLQKSGFVANTGLADLEPLCQTALRVAVLGA